MAITDIFQASNVVMAAAPPSYVEPDANGIGVTGSALGYRVTIDSPLYANGSTADVAIELRAPGNVWNQIASVGGLPLGSHVDDGVTTTQSILEFTITNGVSNHNAVRLRVDRIPAGTISTVTFSKIT